MVWFLRLVDRKVLTGNRDVHQIKFPECPFFTATVDPSYGKVQVGPEEAVRALPRYSVLWLTSFMIEQIFQDVCKIARIEKVGPIMVNHLHAEPHLVGMSPPLICPSKQKWESPQLMRRLRNLLQERPPNFGLH